MLFVLTDGQPTDMTATRKALKMAHKIGLEVYGVGILDGSINNILPDASRVIYSWRNFPPCCLSCCMTFLRGRMAHVYRKTCMEVPKMRLCRRARFHQIGRKAWNSHRRSYRRLCRVLCLWLVHSVSCSQSRKLQRACLRPSVRSFDGKPDRPCP